MPSRASEALTPLEGRERREKGERHERRQGALGMGRGGGWNSSEFGTMRQSRPASSLGPAREASRSRPACPRVSIQYMGTSPIRNSQPPRINIGPLAQSKCRVREGGIFLCARYPYTLEKARHHLRTWRTSTRPPRVCLPNTPNLPSSRDPFITQMTDSQNSTTFIGS